jgi:hypothetical protein
MTYELSHVAKGKRSVPAQEERITALEHTFKEYRPVLQSVAYELTMVKGIIMDQSSINHEVREDVSDIKERLTYIEKRLDAMDRIEEKLNLILTFLKPS